MKIISSSKTETGRTVWYAVDVVVEHNGKQYGIEGTVMETYDANTGSQTSELMGQDLNPEDTLKFVVEPTEAEMSGEEYADILSAVETYIKEKM